MASRSRNRLPDTQQTTLGLSGVLMQKAAPDMAPEATRFAAEQEVFLGNQSVGDYLKAGKQFLPLMLKKLVREQDLSNLCEAQEVGRKPIHPRVMVALIVYGLLQNRTSLRELEALARLDLGAMFLCGGLQPDHSTIGRFISKYAKVLTEAFFVEVTGRLAKKLGAGGGHAAIDGTVVQAASSAYRTLKLEAMREYASDLAQKAAEAPEQQPKADVAARAVAIAEQRVAAREESHGETPTSLRVSPTEPDAVVQPLKQGGVAPSYKPSIVADESGLIAGQVVVPSSESAAVASLLDQHEKILGVAPASLSCDAGYSNATTLQECVDRGLNALIPAGRERSPGMKPQRQNGSFAKQDFTYDDNSDSYRCPAGKSLLVTIRFRGAKPYVRYDANPSDCAACPLKARCTTKARRTIKRFPVDDMKDAMASILAHPLAREHYAQRKVIVETRFSTLKVRQGLRRFRRRGLVGVRVEFALHCLAYNLGLAARRALAGALSLLFVLLGLHRPPRSERLPLGRHLPLARLSPRLEPFL